MPFLQPPILRTLRLSSSLFALLFLSMPSKVHHLSQASSPPPSIPAPFIIVPHCSFSMPVKGAHAALQVRVPVPAPYSAMASKLKPLHLLFLVVSLHFVASLGLTDSEILLKFKSSLSNAQGLTSWSDQNAPCAGDVAKWNGVFCFNGSVWGLQLEKMGLGGKIDVETLKDMPNLRTLSFMNNNFNGSIPEFNKLGALRSLYLSNNQFSGEIPGDAFAGLLKLKKVYLAQNKFTGPIPSSLASLPKLMELRLDGNQFTGKIPDLTHTFQTFNVSNNALEGSIPAGLGKIDSSSFAGNKGLCGPPLSECTGNDSDSSSASDSSTNNKSNSKKPSVASIVIVAVVVAIALAAILAAIVILLRRRNQTPESSVEAGTPSNLQKKTGFKDADQGSQSSSVHSVGSRKAETAKLSFVRDDRERFDLPDLLKASAEILGSGCFGSSYKAALTTGPVMVVKRFKQMNNVGREDFQEHMRRLGRLRHSNLLPLVAYYYRKEEKLLVSDFVEKGSLAVHLHGHQALGQPCLDWPTRLKIVKGVAKGLGYLYKELPSIIAAHGHLKSSNVLLNQEYEPLLTDYGLVPVINQESAQELMVAYKSPEYVQHGRITKKTDVWGLGMLILEILTGKLPANFLPQGKNEEPDLASWVNSVPQEAWANEVFDKELVPTKSNAEGEMIKLVKIALSCCEGDVEKRLDLKEAVERIEELKEKDGDDDFFSSHASEGDNKSSRGMPDDSNF